MTTSDNTNREGVLRRVQKLLAIAQDSRANEHEALAAARQAETIMRKYQIEHADLIATDLKRGEDLSQEEVVVTAKDNGTAVKSVPNWCSWVAFEIAKLNDCQMRFTYVVTKKGMEQAVQFCGYTADVKVAGWMLQYLVDTINRLCKDYRSDPYYLRHGRSVMNAYRHGVVQGVLHNLREAAAEKKAAMQEAVASRALVVVKEQAITDKFGEFKYRKSTTKEDLDSLAFSEGRIVGSKVDVKKQAITNDAKVVQQLN